jgi:hypothetical protein
MVTRWYYFCLLIGCDVLPQYWLVFIVSAGLEFLSSEVDILAAAPLQ